MKAFLMRINRLIILTKRTYHQYGMKETLKRIANKVKSKLWGRTESVPATNERILRDVLFVNGCDPIAAPHPYRYRVLHQMEQLAAAGFTVNSIYYTDCTPMSVLDGRIIVFYRCPYTENIGGAIKLAKELNKRVLFDIDDLVIDKKYTDMIPSVQKLNKAERALYDEGVIRMGATLKMCEAATTTTKRLSEELLHYVPSVYINRNCASECMMKISADAYQHKVKHDEHVIIGYFSGSLTHNADFEMIKPAIIRVMQENLNVQLLIMGDLDLPKELKPFAGRIIKKPFSDWKKLPYVISSVDINLAPVENTVFNEAKSENKWVEASLVGVVTVASRVGAFVEAICDGQTGFLCDENQWYDTLTALVHQPEKRNKVAEAARAYCLEHYASIKNTIGLREYYRQSASRHIAFVLPSCEISGGIMVALYHACFLQDAGWDVELIAPVATSMIYEFFGHRFSCISRDDQITHNEMYYDSMVATMWSTVDYVMCYPKVKKRYYLVQNYETDFYSHDRAERIACEKTYCNDLGLNYITISKWCENWLTAHYHQKVQYARNGINLSCFKFKKREMDRKQKVRILIEGDCGVSYKNVDESFEIARRLDRDRFEVWYLSYNAKPKEQYQYDRFFHKVPYEKVHEIYEQCDILLKSSILESFSYPPLEMMATGGYCVVAPNCGNVEYLVHEGNCLMYPQGDIQAAVSAIDRICSDVLLQNTLAQNGRETAQGRDWEKLRQEVLKLYEE